MRIILTLIKRELGVYFVSPIAYIILTAYLLVSGYFFFYGGINLFILYHLPANCEVIFEIISFLTLFMPSFITMRLLAEEKNKGTIEILLTAPITEFEIVFSKYLASVLFYIILLVPSLFYILLLGTYSYPDYGEIVGGYISVVLLALVLLAIGIFISAICNNQISAGIITLVISILLLSFNLIGNIVKDKDLREILSYLNIQKHIETLRKGIVDTRDIIFMLSIVVLFIFLTVKIVKTRRWK